ncbi:DUF4410 domain-containing protein [Bibersteinia trehalosi]|uniref:DUF4410 domain-containing protein n=1 Tax=Bibersteinia trehalosi TaxID=47735 RepID=UPI004045F6EB
MKKLLSLFILGLSLILTGCSSLKTENNLERNPETKYASFKVVNTTSEHSIDPKVANLFGAELRVQLSKFGYKEGDDVTISYSVDAFDQGNRALRMFVGFGVGKGTMEFSTALKDKSGKSLGNISTESALKMGFFGGSLDNLIRKNAIAVATRIHKAKIFQKAEQAKE